MKRSTKLLALIALITASLAITPAGANAETIEHQVCNDPSLSVWELGFFSQGTAPFELSAECPDLRLDMWAAATRGQSSTHALLVAEGLQKLNATLSGGPTTTTTGVVVRLRVCSFDSCGRALTAGTAGAAAAGELTLADGIPANAVNLVIEAECTRAAGCSMQPDVVISDLTLTYGRVDETPPVFVLTDAWETPYSATTPTLFEPYDYVYARPDEGETMWWTINDGPTINTDCSTLPEDPIPSNCGFFGMVRPPLFEGVIKLTVYIQDLSGNTGSASALLSNDSTPPGPPEDLQVEDGDGWINEYEFSATWNNPAEATDVAGAKFTIHNEDDQLVRQETVEGADVEALHTLVSYSGKFTLTVWLFDESGNEGASTTVEFARDWIPPVAPPIATIPVVNSAYMDSGLTITWEDATYWDTSFSGVCEYRVAINSLPRYEPTTGSDVTLVPFSESPSFVISRSELSTISEGVHYFHVAGTSCAGVRGPASHAQIVIDRIPPTVASEPESGGWLAPGKPLVLRAEDSDPDNSYAGVSTITYAVDGGASTLVGGPKATISLAQGMHTVTFHAEDVAGNKSPVATVQTGVDAQAPGAAFSAVDPADPALVRADVSDPDSGVADAWIEYRPPGSPTWARLIGSSEGDSPRTLAARFPDDDSMPHGEYLLRIVARDHAGNTGSTTTRVDGSAASVTLPLRRRAALTLSVALSAMGPTSSSLTVPFGSQVVARGTLRDADGAPLAGAQVAITESVSGGQRRQIAAATTDAAGSYSALVLAGPSRVLVANFRGDSLRGSATASATFNVRARVTLKKLPRFVKSGKRFYLRGRVDPGVVSLPTAGARVVIQHRSGKRWSDLVATRRTFSDGSYEVEWTQKTRGKRLRMVFRVAVEPEAGWPYATGYSSSRSVVIR